MTQFTINTFLLYVNNVPLNMKNLNNYILCVILTAVPGCCTTAVTCIDRFVFNMLSQQCHNVSNNIQIDCQNVQIKENPLNIKDRLIKYVLSYEPT